MPATINNIVRVDLGQHKNQQSTVFTGRPQGREARKKLALDLKDQTGEVTCFVLPAETTSLNPSFFLGLLYDSFKHYKGGEGFDVHYSFDLSKIAPEFKIVIQRNLEDGKRHAVNSYNNKTVLHTL